MAITKVAQSKSLSIEVKSGVDSKGADTYSKKSFANVRKDVEPQDAYDVAEAIKAVLDQPTRSYFLNSASTLVNA
ncbi:DUF1659 domain-containing protein [Clostridium beijerinckii]|uniref:DUF1659 domain-containing protein n=1 Tax=Clostridium beijerinckii TaxID=1520 RepID=UPI00136130E0|nr:DUF1659 domain-containing protein [Clostridium beijerinckii]MZK53605.1 DUF1659 domain-containing protein [Clostridium beijerinckii]MZK61710.1 DUF1659 domain-containing protein [Clostridium beijerinckii]MZK71476.1 DUF1659 domain-containing protein [Clostridium beijerinckii]MZK76835.1 DUF1659 domain-containing protein [Clostridium beijerinckii]MZK85539.1 DUF1659 domain-containing protein [Clostridium beijerinckii]